MPPEGIFNNRKRDEVSVRISKKLIKRLKFNSKSNGGGAQTAAAAKGD
jgi:hypothetical protein